MQGKTDTLRSLVGGRWAISWRGYLLAWPWAVFFLASGTPSIWQSSTLLEGIVRALVVGTAAYLPTGAVLWLASITILAKRRVNPAPIWIVAVTGAVAWTARTGAILAYLSQQGLASAVPPTERMVAGCLQGAIAVTLTAWLFGTLDRFHQSRKDLLSDLVMHELNADGLKREIEQMRASLLEDVRRHVTGSARALERLASTDSPTTSTIDELTDVSQRMTRELPRELWDRAEGNARIRVLTVVRSAVRNRPFAYWALLPNIALGLFVLAIYGGIQSAVVVVSAVSTAVLVISSLANYLTPRLSPTWGLIAYAGAVILLGVGAPLTLLTATEWIGLRVPSDLALAWLTGLDFAVIYPLLGVAAHIGREQQAVLARLRRSITTADIRQEALRREQQRLVRELAVSLHGGLQADLTAIAMRAQRAIDMGDNATAQDALEEARHMVERGLATTQRIPTDIGQATHAVARAWAGLVDVTESIELTCEVQPRTAVIVKDIILEAVSNAVRHGNAKRIHIHVRHDASDLHLTITDDGTGIVEQRPGLGSAVLNDYAPGAWELKQIASSGACLSVWLTADRLALDL